ncbi:MAG: CBS domain-containing protein [Deltaproteobacteria bacterium]|nr:CBS domain-containing protein [Deltaproteobacteria bacterium]
MKISDEDIQNLIDSICVRSVEGLDGSILCTSVGAIKLREASVVAPSVKTRDVIRLCQMSNRGVVVIMTSKIEGVFSERDIVKKFFDLDLDAPIKSYMTSPVKTISPVEPLAFALTLMSKGGFRHLPVVQDDHLVGVLSVRDILEFISYKIFERIVE